MCATVTICSNLKPFCSHIPAASAAGDLQVPLSATGMWDHVFGDNHLLLLLTDSIGSGRRWYLERAQGHVFDVERDSSHCAAVSSLATTYRNNQQWAPTVSLCYCMPSIVMCLGMRV